VGVDRAEPVKLFLAGLIASREAARRCGLEESDFRSLLREVQLDAGSFVPARLDGDLGVTFLQLGRDALATPTFDEAIDSGRGRDGIAPPQFQLPAAAILDCPRREQAPSFGGLVLHVGRAGSTLLCNLLTAAFGWVSAREPEFVNSLLLDIAINKAPERRELLERLLQSLANGLRCERNHPEFRSILKLSSWNALFAREIISLLGDIPIVVLTREPAASVASLLHSPPWWDAARATLGAARRRERVGDLALTWAGIIDAALSLPRERIFFIDYSELVADPVGVLEAISAHFRSPPRPVRPDLIRPALLHYSKSAAPEPFDSKLRHFRPVLEPGLAALVEAVTSESRSALAERSAAQLWSGRGRAMMPAILTAASESRKMMISGSAT
jgi:hypothetical protein